ncbi:disease resistance protein RPM1-like [Salvia hispanica]|uniref:disease resistance protein RPM1-like n=1 Tax=Salvia hispanica TaxID=49212 RepID=UPI002009B91D|nr:disease resistance protein RPM1-like [Salvia hispanica]
MGENIAVDAVASVVLNKLRELIKDKSFASNKIIDHRLKQMERKLKDTSWLTLVGAEEIKNLRKEYLDEIYSIEDSIESFALRFTRQRKKLGFLMNHALFLKYFTALKMLDFKLRHIQRNVKKLNIRTNSLESYNTMGRLEIKQSPTLSFIHEETQGLSSSMNCVNTRKNSLESSNKEGRLEIKQIHEESQGQSSSMNSVESRTNSLESSDIDGRLEIKQAPTLTSIREETQGLSSSMKRVKSSPVFGNIKERPPALCKNRSFKVLSRSHASMIRERWEHSKLIYSHSYNGKGLSMVGYEGKVGDLLHRLEYSDDLIIPIVGELGSGKTMLARAVYRNRSIKNKFKPAAFVNIFKESTVTDILLALLNQVKKKSEVQNGSDEKSLESLKEELNDKMYLVVLDGVQSLNQWKRLKDAFPDQQNGSKIILTTRDERVAMHADPMGRQIYNLEKLSPEESWALFIRKVGFKTHPENSLKEKINDVCRGLPLNIVLLGSLLSMKQRGEWSEIVKKIDRNWQASDIMNFSYNDLDHHLKLCLIYMALFPREIDIPVRRLIRLWLAEGFVERRQKHGGFQEDEAHYYFKNMVKRSLIMVSKQRPDGSARSCRLQGALHDLLMEQARDIRLFHVNRGSDGSFEMRRHVEYSADAWNALPKPSQMQHLRSYISLNLQKSDTPAKNANSLLKEMGKRLGLLRVLDLEGVFKPRLPDNLGDLFHLSYLGLRWTFLDKLPKSVGELPYLQTLDLKQTRIHKIPATIWKLKNLQHLNLHEFHLDKDCHESLPDLLTLWGLSVSHESPINNGLSKMKHLRELGISFRFIQRSDDDAVQDRGHDQSTEDLVEWISKLRDLQSLMLRSLDDCGKPSALSLRPFSGLIKLSDMKLLGKLQQLPTWDQFPPHIKVLTLSLTSLSQDPMPTLGQLPKLTVLRLLGNSFLGEEMVCPSESFKNLEVLKLWVLQDLKEWKVEDGAMKKLKEVNIRRCSKLLNFPASLLEQETFQDLILNNMPSEFKNNIANEYQWKVSTEDFCQHLYG